jgi:hypothetical protein
MLLFTDGCPNVEPPRGHVPSMLWYTSSNEIPVNHTVKTFGFGYSLDSKLLGEIAVTGNGGTFSFIPDAGMVGTIFIHAVASILSSVQGLSGANLRVHYKKKAINSQQALNDLVVQDANDADVPMSAFQVNMSGASVNANANVDIPSIYEGSGFKMDGSEHDSQHVQRIRQVAAGQLAYVTKVEEGVNECCVDIPMGCVEYGQARDLILKNVEVTRVELRYSENGVSKEQKLGLSGIRVVDRDIAGDASEFAFQRKVALPHFLRYEMCVLLHEIVNDGKTHFGVDRNNRGPSGQTRPARYMNRAQKRSAVERLIQKFEGEDAAYNPAGASVEPDAEAAGSGPADFELVHEPDSEMGLEGQMAGLSLNVKQPFAGESNADNKKAVAESQRLYEAVLKDLKGQVLEGLESDSAYNKWGDYYYRSLMFAHLYQRRNNFKDFGVQCYGATPANGVFEKQVDRVNGIFDNIEPPKPSVVTSSTRYVSSMSSYNNCYGPCFSADSTLTVMQQLPRAGRRGSVIDVEKRCDEIRRGDVLVSVDGETGKRSLGKVRAVTKTVGKGMILINFKCLSGLKITPWHPMLWEQTVDGETESEWVFPAEATQKFNLEYGVDYTTEYDAGVVYNFLLEKASDEVEDAWENHRTVQVNGVTTVALGHGMDNGGILHHPYFANYNLVERDLSGMWGWSESHGTGGVVELQSDNCCVKCMATGLVEKMVQTLGDKLEAGARQAQKATIQMDMVNANNESPREWSTPKNVSFGQKPSLLTAADPSIADLEGGVRMPSPARSLKRVNTALKEKSVVEKIRTDMVEMLNRNSSKEAIKMSDIDTECSHQIEVQIVKTPSRAQVVEKKRRWTFGLGGNYRNKTSPAKEVEKYQEQQLRQQRARKSCMSKFSFVNSLTLKRTKSNLKGEHESYEIEMEDAEDLERGLEELSVLSMGLKRAKSSHKPMMDLQVVTTSAASSDSGLFSA